MRLCERVQMLIRANFWRDPGQACARIRPRRRTGAADMQVSAGGRGQHTPAVARGADAGAQTRCALDRDARLKHIISRSRLP